MFLNKSLGICIMIDDSNPDGLDVSINCIDKDDVESIGDLVSEFRRVANWLEGVQSSFKSKENCDSIELEFSDE